MTGLAVFAGAAERDELYEQKVQPFLTQYCAGCHGGNKPKQGLSLESPDGATPKALADQDILEEMVDQLRARTMPPSDADRQPTTAQRDAVTQWLDARIDRMLGADKPNPGRVTIRRLTRVDYRNTIGDLLGLEVDTSNFPSDDVAHGFDNLADVISLPPLLMEKYLDAAETISERWFAKRFGDDESAWPGKGNPDEAWLRQTLTPIMERAFRRPSGGREIEGLLQFYADVRKAGFGFEQAMKASLQKILVSPNFLFRIEEDGPIGQDRQLDDFELATRLSYFLWSTMPDDELFDLAKRGVLQSGGHLEAQVRRMLADPKVRDGLVGNFAGQWLQTQRLRAIRPDEKLFPQFNDALRRDMEQETLRLFEHIVREDRPITELLDADYTFLNERLARHYGVDDVAGDAFRRVSLTGAPRRGVLTHASVLAINSHPTRTSPVLRGKWIMEAILGTPPPPPVADAGSLESVEVGGTVRQRLEAHRANPRCASCHGALDPLGLAFENYDAIGRWRTSDAGHPVDATGKLADGGSFDNGIELIALLRNERDGDFRKSMASQMLVYALGRKLERYDRAVVRQVTERTMSHGDRLSSMVLAIVESEPFRLRRNPGRVGIAKLPGDLQYELAGNPDQQMILKIQPRDGSAAAHGKSVAFELHALKPLLKAVVIDGGPLTLGDRSGGGDEPFRYPVEAPLGEKLQLMFMEGFIGPKEYSDDFLMPVASIGDIDTNEVIQVATWNQRWGSSLVGPNNPMPGTIYAFDFDVELVAKQHDVVDAWINIGGAHNRSVFHAGGQFKIEGEGRHRLTRVGRRSLSMGGAWAHDISLLIRTRTQTVVSNLSLIRFIRPQLAVSDASPIDLGAVAVGAAAESAQRHVYNGQEIVLTDHQGADWPTILYGTARLYVPDEKRPYNIDTRHVGIELVGPDADKFRLVGPHVSDDGREMRLIGDDDVEGLHGGKSPERQPFKVHFKAPDKAGTYSAAVRIVTQAGGVGEISKGGEGMPAKGLYYLDIPVTATVK